ncbi:polymorphic toxin-type HINT domain-containing protein [Actinospica robiniae]|uniref:polymorphic toxin-type HINT domain-containing protein n=1 Tax=Actinospica robiniae TaxID=304901 RepID=UPI000A051E5C|nr:polymorphic toxin-type HINT domain-containing protein [Actinospica robiniae]
MSTAWNDSTSYISHNFVGVAIGTIVTIGAVTCIVVSEGACAIALAAGWEAGGLGGAAFACVISTVCEGTGAAAFCTLMTCEGTLGGGGGGCVSVGGESFTSGTQVLLADGKAEPIASLKIGDKVKSHDTATGKSESQTVDAVLVHHDSNLYDLAVTTAYGTATIHTTLNHPIWDITKHAWIDAGDLHIDDQLLAADGTAVTAQGGGAPKQDEGWMWDLTISNDHDFYIVAGNDALLVHNDSCTLSQYQAGLDRANSIDRSQFPDPSDGRMTGLLVMDNGQSKELMSGTPNAYPGYVPPPGAGPGTYAYHLEPQAAALVRGATGVQKATLYISGTYVCDTCSSTLGNMLPNGVQLTVVYNGSNGMPASKMFQGGWP